MLISLIQGLSGALTSAPNMDKLAKLTGIFKLLIGGSLATVLPLTTKLNLLENLASLAKSSAALTRQVFLGGALIKAHLLMPPLLIRLYRLTAMRNAFDYLHPPVYEAHKTPYIQTSHFHAFT